MPSITDQLQRVLDNARACDHDDGAGPAVQERAAFEASFARNAKGNLARVYNGEVLTVFRRGDGFAWCIAGDGPRYSPDNYDNEAEAVEGLARECGLSGPCYSEPPPPAAN